MLFIKKAKTAELCLKIPLSKKNATYLHLGLA